MAKAKQGYSWAYNHEAMKVVVTDKASEDNAAFLAEDLPEDIRDRALLYGIGKLLQDRNSQVAAADKMSAFGKTWDQLTDGTWKQERTFGARLLPAVVEAIAKRKGCSAAAAQKAYRALDDAAKQVIRENLAEDIKAIEAARAGASEVSLDDLI